jgi:succinate dehydrogenase/fumarate reductase flavoprotein subunit
VCEPDALKPTLSLIAGQASSRHTVNTAQLVRELQSTMWEGVGPLRTEAKLMHAIGKLDDMTRQIGDLPPPSRGAFDLQRLEWFDLRNMLLVARAVAQAALQRNESRGAHQREDFPATAPQWQVNQRVQLSGNELSVSQRVASMVAP